MQGFWPILVGLGLLIGFCILAFRIGAYTLAGLVTITGIYMLTALGGGWVWGALVLLYFASAIGWSWYGNKSKALTLNRLLGRARFEWSFVAGQLGWGCVLAIIAWVGRVNIILTGAFVGVMAFAIADTWATEIGALSKVKPRRITTGLPTSAGTPGAVSILGLVSATGGAWLTGFTALACYFIMALSDMFFWAGALLWLPIGATLGGLAGTLVDSLLGSTAQGMYYCDHCQRISEEPIHECGMPARQISGWRWLNNQGVDIASSLVGAAVTASIVLLASLSVS